MKYYIFGPLVEPDYDHMVCLAGPFDTKQQALETVKAELGQFRNWIVSGNPLDNLTVGSQVSVKPKKVTQDD